MWCFSNYPDKEKALKEAKSSKKKLSSQVTVAKEALEEEREFCMKHVQELGKECDGVINDSIQGAGDALQRFIDHIKVFCLGIEIPRERIDLQKKVIDNEIINDGEEAIEDGVEDNKEVEEDEGLEGEA